MPVTVRWVANRASSVVNRSIPPVFSSSDGQHRHAADHHDHAPGHRQDRRFLVGDFRQREHDRRGECPHPHVGPETDHPDDQERRSLPSVDPCLARSSLDSAGNRGGGMAGLVEPVTEKPPTAECEITQAGDERVGQQVSTGSSARSKPGIPIRAIKLVGDDPRRGDRRTAPATQPCATMMRHEKREIFARPATAIAKGATNAAAAIFPAPIDAMLNDRPKNTIGIKPSFPPAAPERRADHLVQRAVASGQGEQQRHSHQGQEQVGGKTGR